MTTTTEPTTVVVPAIEVPTSHIAAVRHLVDLLGAPALMEALERFYVDQLPTYLTCEAQGDAFDAWCRATGWDDLLQVVQPLVGAIRAATDTVCTQVVYPSWADEIAESQRQADLHSFDRERQQAADAFERGMRAGHALGAKG